MPTIEWLKKEFAYGYESGDILSWFPDRTRRKEQRLIGGSYRRFFRKSFVKYVKPDSKVMELGPGQGAWSRAILNYIPEGELHTLDFQDVCKWLRPNDYKGRLNCHRVEDNSFACVPDDYFDVFWSFGVLCHQNQEHLREILSNAISKVRIGGVAIHQYADWTKLDRCRWRKRHGVPKGFRDLPDDEIWWPRNNQESMTEICENAGWHVVTADLDFFKRDSVIVLERPQSKTQANAQAA